MSLKAQLVGSQRYRLVKCGALSVKTLNVQAEGLLKALEALCVVANIAVATATPRPLAQQVQRCRVRVSDSLRQLFGLPHGEPSRFVQD
ncbi:hypothetical protein EVC45_16615 [Paraburkholderia sp. UYCP14C]|uniref:hypothetical protein n=1 Tax=Paraburkholderia sp. UYCP14C TaxID=2511130 RepID=UPI001020AA0A|nr:hypothetical protein [Paraburkholderia sp. UYCP14C]RZF28484.1 hypothetical protein EVC45_16615 [Paraburkholderia sp. UYCP14C]